MGNSTRNITTYFHIPLTVIAGILVYLATNALGFTEPARLVILLTIFVGSGRLLLDTAKSISRRQFALDYIALLAIVVGIVTQNYLVAGVIVLMLSGGHALEEFAAQNAKRSLSALAKRLPDEVLVLHGKDTKTTKIADVEIGQTILVRKGEVIPLDGTLASSSAVIDESSLTGEPYAPDKETGDSVRSGTVNVGDAIEITVTKRDEDSTYHKIIEMVRKAQEEQSPFVRLADKYSTWFTIITLAIAAAAYLMTGNFERVLAVLVIATPCPLIIATPIALIGGMNAAAKRHIIIKQLAVIEALARTKAIIFDKTGTITLGKPVVSDVRVTSNTLSHLEALGIAASLERNSLHPLAKAILVAAKAGKAPVKHATTISETIGAGMSGTVDGVRYTLQKHGGASGMAIALLHNKKTLATIHFEDRLKNSSKKGLQYLRFHGLELAIYTGDKLAAAEKIVEKLGFNIAIKAECTPEDKRLGIKALQNDGKVVAMVGDGLNDAPALALADVGMVFSHEEQTAASEAADIVFLGGNFGLVVDAIHISRRTISIAIQSILVGIGLSIAGMVLAAIGIIPPLTGAFLQEAIDIAVILNALRASRYHESELI